MILTGAVMGHFRVNDAGKEGAVMGRYRVEDGRHCDGTLSSGGCWEGGRCNEALSSGGCRRCKREGLEGHCKGKEIKERGNKRELGAAVVDWLRCWKRGGTRERNNSRQENFFSFSFLVYQIHMLAYIGIR